MSSRDNADKADDADEADGADEADDSSEADDAGEADAADQADETSITILENARHGDEQALGKLLQFYLPAIKFRIQRNVFEPHDADDVLQEVCVTVCRRLKQFERQRRGSFRRWMWTIVTSRVSDFFRRRNRQPELLTDSRLEKIAASGSTSEASGASAESAHDSDDNAADQVIIRTAVLNVRGRAKPQTWQVFEGFVWGAASAADLATRFRMTEKNVYDIKRRVVQNIRKELAQYGSEDLIDEGHLNGI